MSDCGHPILRTGDTFDQIRRVTPCLFCERDRLRIALERFEDLERYARRWRAVVSEYASHPKVLDLIAAIDRILIKPTSPCDGGQWMDCIDMPGKLVCSECARIQENHATPADPECQHDLLKPDTTIEVIDKWKAKCKVCIEFFDLPGRPEPSISEHRATFFGDEP